MLRSRWNRRNDVEPDAATSRKNCPANRYSGALSFSKEHHRNCVACRSWRPALASNPYAILLTTPLRCISFPGTRSFPHARPPPETKISREPVVSRVRQLDRLTLVGNLDDRRDRATNLLLQNVRIGADSIQHRRRTVAPEGAREPSPIARPASSAYQRKNSAA